MSDPERGSELERSGAELLRRPARKYYSIREVSEMLEVKAHVLRYWETQFPFLRPRKHAGGARMYQDRDLDLLRSIREMLYDRGYTIAGARQRLRQERRARESDRAQIELDFVAPSDHRRLREIRDELAEIAALLLEKPGAVARSAARGRGASRGPGDPKGPGAPDEPNDTGGSREPEGRGADEGEVGSRDISVDPPGAGR